MANGNVEVMRELKTIVKEGKTVDIDTRDRLLFTAIIDIYEKLELVLALIPYAKIGGVIVASMGTLLIGLIFGIFTGQVELTFK